MTKTKGGNPNIRIFCKGEDKESSDLDLLVEFKGDRSLLDLAGLKMELEELLKMRVDVLTYDPCILF